MPSSHPIHRRQVRTLSSSSRSPHPTQIAYILRVHFPDRSPAMLFLGLHRPTIRLLLKGSNLLQAVGENSVTSSSLAALVSCTEAVEGAIPAASEQATTNGLRRPPTLSGPVLREEGSAHDAPPHGPSFENKADPLKALPLPISAKGMVSPSAQGVDSTDEHQVSSDRPPQSPLVLPTVASAPPTEVVVENEDAPSTSVPSALVPSALVPSALVPSAKPQVTPCYSPLPGEIFGPPAHVSSNAPYASLPSSQPQVPTHAPLADAVVVQLSSSSANTLQPAVPRTAKHLQYTPPPLWRIDFNRYRKGDCVGVGTQGSVFKCIDTLHKRPVAVKISKCDSRGRPPNTMLREISALRSAVHANIVYLTDILFDGTDIGIVLPLCDSSLRSLITSNMGFGRNFSLQTLTSFLRQILEGLHYLHEHRKFAHFDLKPENILVDKNERIRLADFGLSRPPNEPDPQRTVVTCEYRPPEVFLRSPSLSVTVDIWSFGVVTQELMGSIPWRHLRNNPPATFDAIMRHCGTSNELGRVGDHISEVFPGANKLP
ncbi:unnamed protein product, partial [Tilletia caries]